MRKDIFLWAILVLFISQWSIFSAVCRADSKKVLMVIAAGDFRDEEFKIPFESLKKEGYQVVVASTILGPVSGMLGETVTPDILLETARPSDYDAVIFVGGIGAQSLWNDVNAKELAKSMYKDGKIVTAICLAPVILANAGILQGKKATVWMSEGNRLALKGATYTGKPVEIDDNIITADGPSNAGKFADAVIRKLGESNKAQTYGTK